MALTTLRWNAYGQERDGLKCLSSDSLPPMVPVAKRCVIVGLDAKQVPKKNTTE